MMKPKFLKLIWGTFWLLAAAFIIVSQLDGFANIGVGSIIVTILSVAFIVQCVAYLKFAPLPVPLAVLYVIFRTTLGWPEINAWALIAASVLASLGLVMLLPGPRWGNGKPRAKSGDSCHQEVRTESVSGDDNPSVSVNFGAVSRRIQSGNLESVRLYCNFGALEIYLDGARPCANGAEADLNCSFGAMKLFVPKHWRVIDRINCALGGVDMDKTFASAPENAPRLTLTGSVSLGGVEVRSV
jgi:hypothetical protein